MVIINKKILNKYKILIYILFIFINLNSFTNADDIRDFELEGMSLGESALNYFSKSILEKNKQHDWFNSKKFIPIAELTLSNSITYESFQIAVKNKDQNYKIEMLAGFVFYKDNIDDCYDKIDTIALEIKNLFNNITVLDKNTFKHSFDKSGKSTITDISLIDNNDNELSIQCYDWSEEYTYWDQLRIRISSKEYAKWVRSLQ